MPVSSGVRRACLIVQLETADKRFPAEQQAHTVLPMLPYESASRKDIIIERKDPRTPLQVCEIPPAPSSKSAFENPRLNEVLNALLGFPEVIQRCLRIQFLSNGVRVRVQRPKGNP